MTAPDDPVARFLDDVAALGEAVLDAFAEAAERVLGPPPIDVDVVEGPLVPLDAIAPLGRIADVVPIAPPAPPTPRHAAGPHRHPTPHHRPALAAYAALAAVAVWALHRGARR